MITILLGGLGALVVLAVLVGLVDASRAGEWRRVARERRTAWEQRQRAATTAERFPDL